MDRPASRKVKRIFKNPNPLFVRWLTEWKIEAEEKDSKLKHTYVKCIRSLKQFPLPLHSGKSCAILRGFGPTVCNKLDQMLEKHKHSVGSVESQTNSESRNRTATTGSRNNTLSAGSRNNTVSAGSRNNIVGAGSGNNIVSAGSRNNVNSSESKNNTDDNMTALSYVCSQPSRKKPSTTRSKKGDDEASRAILHVLQTTAEDANTVCMSRCRVLASARQLMMRKNDVDGADVDRLLSRALLRLQREKLVEKHTGRPVRYSLSPEGRSIASDTFASASAGEQQQQNQSEAAEVNTVSSEKSTDRLVYDSSPIQSTKNDSDEIGASNRPVSGLVYDTTSMASSRCMTSSERVTVLDDDDDAIVVSSDSEHDDLPSENEYILQSASNIISSKSSVIAPNNKINKKSHSSNENTNVTHKVLKQRPLTAFVPTKSSRNNVDIDSCVLPAKSAIGPSNFGSSRDSNRVNTVCKLEAGTFDIILCVDTQETSGTGGSGPRDSRRDRVLTELSRRDVITDIRRLSVGDFIWLARSRQNRQEELVLPWIVERKRLDDLAASIRGTRYKEQKFRLARCGLPNVIYLAEGSVSNVKHIGLPESSLNQALSNSQVVDNFLVQRTADQRDTAQFLAALTNSLHNQYSNRDLFGCLRADLPPPESDIASSASATSRLLTFAEFQRDSAKRQRVCVRDAWARGLLCISGVTDDKACAIVQEYSSPQQLVDAYTQCTSSQQAEQLLAPLKGTRSGRAVGAAISRVVYHWLCDEQLK